MHLRNTNVAFKLEMCGLRCATILKGGVFLLFSRLIFVIILALWRSNLDGKYSLCSIYHPVSAVALRRLAAHLGTKQDLC